MPEAELLVEEVVAAGDRALAWIAVRGAERGDFLGFPVAAEQPRWGRFDAWRVADGRVIERWGEAVGAALLEPLGRIPFDAGSPTRPVVEFERLAVPPDGRLEAWRPDEAHLIYLEAGALTVAVALDSPGSGLLVTAAVVSTAGRPTAVGPGGIRTLAAGDLLALPPLTTHALHNDGAAPAAGLVLTVSHAGAPAYAGARCDAVDPEVSPSCAARAELSA